MCRPIVLTTLYVDAHRLRQQAILDIETKSNQHADTVAKEAQETDELHEAIASLQDQREMHANRKLELESQVQVLQAEIKEHRDAQTIHQKAIDAQARQDIPELRTWEQLLGLRIYGAEKGTERLRFAFQTLNGQLTHQEAWFEMDLASTQQRIIATMPALDQDDIAVLDNKLAQDRDMGSFLKSMRRLLLERQGG